MSIHVILEHFIVAGTKMKQYENMKISKSILRPIVDESYGKVASPDFIVIEYHIIN